MDEFGSSVLVIPDKLKRDPVRGKFGLYIWMRCESLMVTMSSCFDHVL